VNFFSGKIDDSWETAQGVIAGDLSLREKAFWDLLEVIDGIYGVRERRYGEIYDREVEKDDNYSVKAEERKNEGNHLYHVTGYYGERFYLEKIYLWEIEGDNY
jgi:hypothetical protein